MTEGHQIVIVLVGAILAACFAALNAMALYIVSGMRADVRAVRTNVETLSAQLSQGAVEFQRLWGALRIIEHECERNHGRRPRETDPEGFDPSRLRSNQGNRDT